MSVKVRHDDIVLVNFVSTYIFDIMKLKILLLLNCESPKYILLNFFPSGYFPILINWMSPFPILGVLAGIFHFYSNFNGTFCKQTVETLIRCHVLRHLIWVYTVCLCPTKWTLGKIWLILFFLCSKKSFDNSIKGDN